MIKLIAGNDNNFKKQIEILLGKEIPLTASEVNKLAHLTEGNLWIVKVLEKLGLTVDDLIYEKDRDFLKAEIAKSNEC